MRTRETILVGLGLLLALAPAAFAQEPEPTVNESDFDTSGPPSDESYLDEEGGAGGETGPESGTGSEPDPTLGEGDFDMSAPAADTSYLDAEAAADAQPQDETRADAPLPGIVAALGVVALAALALRRRA